MKKLKRLTIVMVWLGVWILGSKPLGVFQRTHDFMCDERISDFWNGWCLMTLGVPLSLIVIFILAVVLKCVYEFIFN